jgi:uncharacterized membrane protein
MTIGPFAACVLAKKTYNITMENSSTTRKSASLPVQGLVALAVFILLVGWLLNTPPGLMGKADAVGYAVCHRIDARSFHLGDRQLPLCARCSGMYLGAIVGLVYLARVSKRRAGFPAWPVWVVFGVFVAAFGVDGLNSYLHLFPGAPGIYEPQNVLRLLTGSGMGLVMASILFPAFNQTIWKDWDAAPVLGGLRDLALPVLFTLILDAIVYTENPLVLFPLALLSAAGVLALLTIVYTMVWTMLLRTENRASTISKLALPLVAGFGTALFQIIILDFIRFLLTGTWEGFHLG